MAQGPRGVLQALQDPRQVVVRVGVVGVKPLREAGEQESVAIDALPARLAASTDE